MLSEDRNNEILGSKGSITEIYVNHQHLRSFLKLYEMSLTEHTHLQCFQSQNSITKVLFNTIGKYRMKNKA